MGWASGSYLAQEVWETVKKYIPKASQQEVAEALVDAFEDHDADDWDYDEGSLYHTAYPEKCEQD